MGFLQGLLLILKILGILLACILGLFLLLVGIALLVPVRYRAELQKNEELRVTARLSWLLHLVSVRISYEKENKLFYELRILGFLFLSSDAEWKKEHEEKRKRKAERRARKKERQKKKRKGEPFVKPEATEPTVSGQEEKGTSVEAENEPTIEPKLVPSEQEEQEELRRGGLRRIMERLKRIFRTIADKIKAIFTAVKKLFSKAKQILGFLTDETNRAAFGAGWATLVRLLKHIGPTRVKGFLAFGMEDPATTGYILAGLGIFYGKFGKSFSIQPNFTEKQLEAELKMRGRVRAGTVLWLLFKLWRNKDVKSLLARLKQAKTKTDG